MRDYRTQMFPLTMDGNLITLDFKQMSDADVLAAYQQWAEQDYDEERARWDAWQLARLRQEMQKRGLSL
jgi:hypothetical protein